MYLRELIESQPRKAKPIRRFTKLLPFLLLAACSGDANHLGNPFFLPLQYATNQAQNASYNQRRASVSAFVVANQADLIDQIGNGGGSALAVAMSLAEVPKDGHRALIQQLRKDIALYRNDAEALTVALMVHGD